LEVHLHTVRVNSEKIACRESGLASPELKGIMSTSGGIFAKAQAHPILVFEQKHRKSPVHWQDLRLIRSQEPRVGRAKL
jgi:hypothetical protein